ncbi:hypothetical protein ACIP5Y_45935 [Nocardia sp. NPDC088792]|uniref:hypothetical protein n=1 Tax=Nocardia sp. NPDC088792 TaxID=3364332 RepID=UPI0038301A28
MPAGPAPRIQVTGRARAGKTTVRHALSLISAEETSAVDDPGRPDPVLDADLLIYVLPGASNATDRRILATLPPDRTLVVLNKADAIGLRWADAAAAAENHSAALQLTVHPVIATLAARTRSGTVTDADLRTLHRHRDHPDPAFTLAPDLFTAPAIATDTADRQRLLARWPLYGISCALIALRHAPTLPAVTLLQILHSASGIDPLHTDLHHRYEQAATRLGT